MLLYTIHLYIWHLCLRACFPAILRAQAFLLAGAGGRWAGIALLWGMQLAWLALRHVCGAFATSLHALACCTLAATPLCVCTFYARACIFAAAHTTLRSPAARLPDLSLLCLCLFSLSLLVMCAYSVSGSMILPISCIRHLALFCVAGLAHAWQNT